MKRLIVLAAFLCISACGSSSPPVAPTVVVQPATIPACQANHTALASFTNNGSRVIDVLLDGGGIGTLAAGQTGLARTVAANVAHDIKFRITNTTLFPCANFNPIPVECSTPAYGSCTGF